MRPTACAAALLAACAHPAPPAHPAELAHLGLPSELRFEGKSEQYGDDPLSWDFTRNDDQLFSRFSVIPWKAAWPDDFAAFGKRADAMTSSRPCSRARAPGAPGARRPRA
jgi:hypothetical protein